MDAKRNNIEKVPVIMQMENLECGAACLAMILAYYGKWKPLEEVRVDCGVSRDGSNAKNIILAARSYGMEAKGFRYSVERLMEVKPFPCIVFWNQEHFVVLKGFRRNKAMVNDPASGLREIPLDEFRESYSGVTLFAEPGEGFEKGGRKKSVWKFARKRLSGTLTAIFFVIITGLLTTLAGVVYPVFGRVFLDRLLPGVNPDWMLPFIALMSGVALFQFVIAVINAVYLLKIRGKFAIEANTSYVWHVLCLPMTFFSQRNVGDVSARQEMNETIAETLVHSLAPQVLNVVMLVFYLTVMLKYSVVLTLIGISSAALNMIFANIISRRRVNMTRVTVRDTANLASATISGIGMIETIKAGGGESGFFKRWSGLQAELNASQISLTKKNQYLSAIPTLLNGIASISILVVGAFLIMQGDFTVGMLLAFQSFLSAFLSPVNGLLGAGQTIVEMRSSMERIEDVMEYPEDILCRNTELPQECKPLTGKLDLSHVSFGYSRLDVPCIDDVSVHLEPGKSIAFVGASGCGKSTISKLICGLYQPWMGEILFDGKKIEEIPREIMTSSLAIVNQEIVLFEDTIENNIKMWDSSISNKDMIQAAIDANIHADILQRPGGYQHKVLEGGRNFSGGQRQRFEIARALAQNPTILIMDEATSALDAETEDQVIEAVRRRGITCIMIAHRLSTIRKCDAIIVLENGRIVGCGTHEELYAKKGYYNQLITME